MDPFTISTGVAGFLGLALEITKILGTYIGEAKSAPEDAHNLVMEVTSLCHVLKEMVQFLRKDATEIGSFQPTSALCVVIGACQAKIEDLYKKLEKLQVKSDNKVAGLIERLKWPLKKEDYQDTILTLHRFIQTFQFSLTVSNWLVFQLHAWRLALNDSG
jgi:hypothetical protein